MQQRWGFDRRSDRLRPLRRVRGDAGEEEEEEEEVRRAISR